MESVIGLFKPSDPHDRLPRRPCRGAADLEWATAGWVD
jgi:hypothetical protein